MPVAIFHTLEEVSFRPASRGGWCRLYGKQATSRPRRAAATHHSAQPDAPRRAERDEPRRGAEEASAQRSPGAAYGQPSLAAKMSQPRPEKAKPGQSARSRRAEPARCACQGDTVVSPPSRTWRSGLRAATRPEQCVHVHAAIVWKRVPHYLGRAGPGRGGEPPLARVGPLGW